MAGSTAGGAYVGNLNFDPTRVPAEAFIPRNTPQLWLDYLQRRDVTADPCNAPIMARLHTRFTLMSSQLCGSQIWFDSTHYNEIMRPAQIVEYLTSIVPLPHLNLFVGTSFMQMAGERPMQLRQRRAVHLMSRELELLWTTPSLAPRPPWTRGLSPRLSQVLEGLSSGLSEKQIARRLGLKRATVHNHVGRLYKVANVSSRGELLAIALPARQFRPKLLV